MDCIQTSLIEYTEPNQSGGNSLYRSKLEVMYCSAET